MSKSSEWINEWSARSWQRLDFFAGRALERSEVEKLEQMVAIDPSEETARVLLLGYYERDARSFRSKAYKIYLNHLILLIEHNPRHDQHEHACIFAHALFLGGILHADRESARERVSQDFDLIKRKWSEAVEQHPDDVRVLRNAAYFFEIVSDETTMKLWMKIKLLDPTVE